MNFTQATTKIATNQRQTNDKQMTTIEEFKEFKEYKEVREDKNKTLSHFEYLNLNFNKDVIELVNEYKPKIKDFDFCIEKFNDSDKKKVSIVVLKSYLNNWLKYDSNNSKPEKNIDDWQTKASRPTNMI